MVVTGGDYERAAAIYPDPRLLMEKDEWHREIPYRNLRGPAGGFVFGLMWRASFNWNASRPLISGLHMYFLYGVGFAVIGTLVQKASLGYFGYRDRVNRHYILTHPEDFPPPPKVKIGEKWEPWVPSR